MCLSRRFSIKNHGSCLLGMGDMGLKIYHDISGIYCDNDISDDNSGNPVSLEKCIIFSYFYPKQGVVSITNVM